MKDDSLISLETSRDWEKSRFVTDLGLLAKVPGQDNENYMICAGFGYNAQIKIVEIITHLESLMDIESNFEKSFGKIPDYFALVFEVKGFDRSSTTADIKFATAINRNEYLRNLIPAQ